MTSRSLVSLAVLTALVVGSTACKDGPVPVTVTNPISPSTPATQGDAVSVFGSVENLTGECPALTLTVNGIVVKTNSATGYAAGPGGCANVKTGDAGGVTGFRQSDGSVVAGFVSLAPPSPLNLIFTGAIAKLSGTCPEVLLTIGLYEVQTRAMTGFDGKPCSELKVGDRVTVSAVRMNVTGPLIANGVDASAAPPPTTGTVIGSVESVSGTCPALVMAMNGIEVRTSAATTFGVPGGCAAIKNGYSGLASGARQPDGSVLAIFVSLSPPK